MTGHETRFAEGETIFRQGDAGDRMFVVVAGRIGLYLEGGGTEHKVASLGPGEFFGELSLLCGMPRSATARASEPSVLLEIGRGAFALIMHDDIGVVFRMMSALGRRFLDSNATRLELVDRLGRIRVITRALGRLACESAFPRSIAVPALAEDLGVAASFLAPVVAELSAQGAGTLEVGTWHFADRDAVQRLVRALDP